MKFEHLDLVHYTKRNADLEKHLIHFQYLSCSSERILFYYYCRYQYIYPVLYIDSPLEPESIRSICSVVVNLMYKYLLSFVIESDVKSTVISLSFILSSINLCLPILKFTINYNLIFLRK